MNEIHLPPYSVCRICHNRMVDVCVESCSPAKDLRHFQPKEVEFSDLPPISMKEWNEMCPKARQMMVGYYLARIVAVLQEEDHGQTIDYPRSRKIPHPLEIAGLFTYSKEEDTVHQTIGEASSDP